MRLAMQRSMMQSKQGTHASGKIDYSKSAQEAFEKFVIKRPMQLLS
jgi:hypothetical protein